MRNRLVRKACVIEDNVEAILRSRRRPTMASLPAPKAERPALPKRSGQVLHTFANGVELLDTKAGAA